MRTGRIATVLGLISLATAATYAADPRAVLERFLARVAATRVTDLTLEQDLTLFNAEGRAPVASGLQRLVFKVPDRQRIEQTVDGKTEIRVTVGGRTWRRGPDGAVSTVRVPRTTPATLALPMHRSAADVLAEWRGLGVRDDRSHDAHIGDRLVTVIGAFSGERDRPAVWLDEAYGVMRFVALEKGEAGDVLADVVFADHRPLAGDLFFPHRHEMFRGGRLLARVIVRSVAVNTGPADALFDPGALGAR